jgi:prevent-host-death family protein
MRAVNVSEANQRFSQLIKEVESGGDGFVIMRRGKPIARLVPLQTDKSDDPQWAGAHADMMNLLEDGLSLGGKPPKRDTLHDR